jgi:hypothetical protein
MNAHGDKWLGLSFSAGAKTSQAEHQEAGEGSKHFGFLFREGLGCGSSVAPGQFPERTKYSPPGRAFSPQV